MTCEKLVCLTAIGAITWIDRKKPLERRKDTANREQMETRENKYVHPGEVRMAKSLIDLINTKAEDGLSPVSLPSC